MAKSICIIPARGGSKRIPKKNIKGFLGKPIIAYSIQVALESGIFDEVIVSTDSQEIKNIALEYGATVPFMRSVKNADDFATLNDVFLEIKQKYNNLGVEVSTYCLILPTAPLISIELLNEGLDFFRQSTFDSVRPVVEFPYPIQRAQRLDEGQVSFINHQFARTRSQDLEPAYFDAGMFYIIKGDKDFTANKGAFIINPILAQDIDNLTDWKIAEFKYSFLYSGK